MKRIRSAFATFRTLALVDSQNPASQLKHKDKDSSGWVNEFGYKHCDPQMLCNTRLADEAYGKRLRNVLDFSLSEESQNQPSISKQQ